ncbi:nitric oxide-associated protein 1 isoform X2 [Anabrus simplex]
MKCQRCHFLSHYNVALNVNVSPEEYPRLLGHIKDKRALVILMVDLTDFPCSIWPGIIDIIGTRRPVVVVGNKVDLLPADGPSFLEHVTTCLETSLNQTSLATANIRHVALVSAATGFGVEELITKLHNIWDYKDDIYLMGCTNVGKSTLFNALLQSDLCKVKAVDLLQRATTSQWPGTTLNLLKFPVLRPAGWRLYQRTQRLMKQSKYNIMERKLRAIQTKKEKDPTRATLIGHIGRTFRDPSQSLDGQDPFSMGLSANSPVQRIGLDPNDEEFIDGRWCYDTPGTVQPDQVLNLLTTQELMLTLPRQLLLPRTFSVRPGQTLLLAGLARLDYLSGGDFVRMTVLASDQLPLTICYTSDADAIYNELVGSTYLGVPCGKSERLAQWPGLSPISQVLRVQGCDWRETAADVVLSSAGWVAITPGPEITCEFQAWTPHGRGVYLRQPPLLRYSVNLRGQRVRKSPAYRQGQAVYVKNYPV